MTRPASFGFRSALVLAAGVALPGPPVAATPPAAAGVTERAAVLGSLASGTH